MYIFSRLLNYEIELCFQVIVETCHCQAGLECFSLFPINEIAHDFEFCNANF